MRSKTMTVLLVPAVVAFWFLIGLFLLLKLWVTLAFQMRDSMAAHVRQLIVKCINIAISKQIKPTFCVANCNVTISTRLADVKIKRLMK